MADIGPYISNFGINNQGLTGNSSIHWNQTAPQLYEAGLRRQEGVLSIDGAFVTETGEYSMLLTGRMRKLTSAQVFANSFYAESAANRATCVSVRSCIVNVV